MSLGTKATATTLENREIIPTFNAIGNLGKFPAGSTGLKVARIHHALKTLAQDIARQDNALYEEYALRDDDDQPKTTTSDDGTEHFVPDPKRRAEFRDKQWELMLDTSEIVAPRLSHFELEQANKKVGFDPGLLSYLLPFVDDAPAPAHGNQVDAPDNAVEA